MRHFKPILLGISIAIFLILISGCQTLEMNIDQKKEQYYIEYYQYISQLEQLETQAFKHAIKIQIEVSSTKTIFGSGVIFESENNKHYILTNYHLVYDENIHQSIFVLDHLEHKFQATYVYGKPEYDLAILVYEDNTQTYSDIRIKNTFPKEIIGTFIAGYPKGESYQFSYGNFTNLEVVTLKGDIENLIQISFEVMSIQSESFNGSSGSAVYHLDGELMGIVFAGNQLIGTLAETYVISSFHVQLFLDLYHEQKTT